MADSFEEEQRQLSQLWKKARKDGCLSPWQQARVDGLREAWKEMHGDKTYGMATWIAERVHVQGPDHEHPTSAAVNQLLKKMSDDVDWLRRGAQSSDHARRNGAPASAERERADACQCP